MNAELAKQIEELKAERATLAAKVEKAEAALNKQQRTKDGVVIGVGDVVFVPYAANPMDWNDAKPTVMRHTVQSLFDVRECYSTEEAAAAALRGPGGDGEEGGRKQ